MFRAFLIGILTLHTVSALCGEDEKKYLLQYGFLDRHKDNTDEDVRGAVLTLQQFYSDYGLNVTGECDNATRLIMKQPRCGCEDVPKKETRMIPAEDPNGPQEYNIGNTKWTKKVLTWKVIKYPSKNKQLGNANVDDAMARGLKIWADQTNLRFEKTASNNADIKISFETRRHTSRPPYYDFDGKSGVLAHAFFPQSGIVHFDDEEDFTLGNNEGTELYIVAAHEFGHTLGISHSNDKKALMAPFYRYAENLQLGQDDIYAVQALYGRKTNTVPDRVTTPTPPPTTTPRGKVLPSQCDMVIDASFRIESTTYVFTTERSRGWRRTYVYKVHDSTGLDVQSRTLVRDMFLSKTNSRRRGYPYHVDAATYMPNIDKVLLISGTRVYKYSIDRTQRDDYKFYIDSKNNYPRWFNVKEIPERPRAAVAMRFGSRYYLFLYSESMMWIWNADNDLYRVSAWAYPIRMFGHLMPHNIDSAFDAGRDKVNFVRGDRVYEFDMTKRRVVSQDSIQNVKTKFFKGTCM